MKTIRIVLIGMAMIAMIACGRKEAPKEVAYGENLKELIDEYEDSRQDLSDEVSDSFESTIDELENDKNPDIPGIAVDWQEKWNTINEQYKQLKADFNEVGTASDQYFRELETLTSGIVNKGIRLQEETLNTELKQNWERTYSEALENIKKIENIVSDGNDFHRVLVASSMRQKLNDNIKELKEINKRALAILKELETITTEGRKLVAS